MKKSPFLISKLIGSIVLILILIFTNRLEGWAIVIDLGVVDNSQQPQAQHVDQLDLVTMVQHGQSLQAFNRAFLLGDALFATSFNALDGGGPTWETASALREFQELT